VSLRPDELIYKLPFNPDDQRLTEKARQRAALEGE
jgi:hypothetical protein